MEILMISLLILLFSIKLNSYLVIENLAMRQQLAIMKQSIKQPKLRNRDRLFWVILSLLCQRWRDFLIIVKPATVIRWNKKGFNLFWKFKSKLKGRSKIDPEIRKLIKKFAKANPTWGAPRIHSELIKLGFTVSEATVTNYMPKRKPKPPSQTWRTFLKNHMFNTCSMDFFTVPTATFKILFVFFIIHNERRKIIHFNVTSNPTAKWTGQQIVEAFPWETTTKYIIRDRDAIYGEVVKTRIKNMNIEQVVTAYKSPWQNPFAERLIGSIRRECLDHVIVLSDGHVKEILKEYFAYYHHDRNHLSLDKDAPYKRPVQDKPKDGKLVELPRVGGLHHRYEWKEAA